MNRELLERQVLYRSSHRGTKEADAILGGFFESELTTCSLKQLVSFEMILQQSDGDIMDWLREEKEIPIRLLSHTMNSLMLYYKKLLNN